MLTKYLFKKNGDKVPRAVRRVFVVVIITVIIARLYIDHCITSREELLEGGVEEKFDEFVFVSGNESEQASLELYTFESGVRKYMDSNGKGLYRVAGTIMVNSANSYKVEKRRIIEQITLVDPLVFSFKAVAVYVSGNLANLRSRIKHEYYSFLTNIFNSNTANLMTTIALGSKQAPESKDLKEKMRLSGLSHILAVSGMHINIVYNIIFLGLTRLVSFSEKIAKHLVLFFCTKFGFDLVKVKEWCSVRLLGLNRGLLLLRMLFLLSYVLFVSISASSLRAFCMLFFALIGRSFLHYAPSKFSILVLVCLLLLFYNPNYVNDVGFLLSFSISFGFVFYSLAVKRSLANYNGIRHFLISKMVVLIPLLFSGAITLFFFNELSLVGILSNALLLWAVPLIMGFSLLFFLFYLNSGLWETFSIFFTPLIRVIDYFFIKLFSVIEYLGSLKWSLLELQNRLSFIWLVCFFIVVGVIFYLLLFRRNHKEQAEIIKVVA